MKDTPPRASHLRLSMNEIIITALVTALVTALFVIIFYSVGIPVLFWLFFVALYCIPSLVAYNRDHPSKMGVLALNILLGWTFIGWLGAFIWSLSGVSISANISLQPTTSIATELEKLASLKDKGILTQEEFDKKKKTLLEI
jgi:Superinfection immunity protein/Short C-terminal domain